MRDSQRIDRMLLKLEWLWKKYPDLRLGQLVANLTPKSSLEYPSANVFFVEDDHMEERIDAVLVGGWEALK